MAESDNPVNFAGFLQYVGQLGQVFQFTIAADGSSTITEILPGTNTYVLAEYHEITSAAKATFRQLNQIANLGLEVSTDVNQVTLDFIKELAPTFRFEELIWPNRAKVKITLFGPGNTPQPQLSYWLDCD